LPAARRPEVRRSRVRRRRCRGARHEADGGPSESPILGDTSGFRGRGVAKSNFKRIAIHLAKFGVFQHCKKKGEPPKWWRNQQIE